MGNGRWLRRILVAAMLGLGTWALHAADAEDGFWQSVRKNNERVEYELYLKQYPNGRYAAEAKKSIEALRDRARAQQEATKGKQGQAAAATRAAEQARQRQAEEETKRLRAEEEVRRLRAEMEEAKRVRAEDEAKRTSDLAFWESVKESKNPEELKAYLDRFPSGIFAGLAQARLRALSAPQYRSADTAAGRGWQSSQVVAGTWPSRPFRIIVPFAAGGPTDTVARILAQRWTGEFGQPVVIENRPGARTLVGMEHVAKAAPDGYTLLLTSGSCFTVNPYIYSRLPFDPQRDFTAIAQVAAAPLVLVTRGSSVYTNPRAFASGRQNFGSPGTGSVSHIALEAFSRAIGGSLVHVPYRGTGPVLAEVTTGQIEGAFVDVWAVRELLGSGKLRALAVTGSARSSLLPNVPTFQELGIAGMQMTSWYGLWVPNNPPAQIVNRLAAAVSNATRSSDFAARVLQIGLAATGVPPADFAQVIESESASMSEIIRAANIRAE